MKKLFLMAVLLLSTMTVFAQKELAVANQYPGDDKALTEYLTAVEKQSNEKTSAIRTTWLADRPSSNWFISGQIGLGGVLSDGNTNISNPFKWFDNKDEAFWHPTYGLAVGKWFSPVWGLRLSGSHGAAQSFDKKDALTTSEKYIEVTADYLINLKNVFLPYNPKGLFNPVLYLGAGVIHTNEHGKHHDGFFNLAEKAGLQLNFRLNDAFNIYLDGKVVLAPSDFDLNPYASVISSDLLPSASIGLTYNINFRHFIKAPLYEQSEIDALNREINELRNRPQVVCPPVVKCPEVVAPVVLPAEVKQELDPVFFLLGSHVVRENQYPAVTAAAEYLKSHPGAKLELASYADKDTGTSAYNLNLSKKRSDAVAQVLISKYGIAKDRLIKKHYGSSVQPFKENDWNRVTIFIKE
ncbi:MAG: OmpA family protein [Candidatus Symbiothrix sp.]|jgi:outer membrane protein OmpA-like peptidoglycan-associated protein|nr:OmpA family protein [Candidatus Symbiothrix sp.]